MGIIGILILFSTYLGINYMAMSKYVEASKKFMLIIQEERVNLENMLISSEFSSQEKKFIFDTLRFGEYQTNLIILSGAGNIDNYLRTVKRKKCNR